MPELPEVETVVRTLAPRVTGLKVVGVRWSAFGPESRGRSGVFSPPVWSDPWPARLVGRRIDSVHRVGKRIVMTLDEGSVSVHLGMTGRLEVVPTAATVPHTHAVVYFAGVDVCLRFSDPRRFGHVVLGDGGNGPAGGDALRIRAAALHRRWHGRTRAVKAMLLDQAVVAGIGNIYADEALFASGVHPSRQAGSLTQSEVATLVRAVKRILRLAIRAGGSTLRDYVNAEGRPGGFQLRHKVYGRAGRPCRKCRTVLEKTVVAQRTTVYCPQCQPV